MNTELPTIHAHGVKEREDGHLELNLERASDISRVYHFLEKGDDFIITWEEEGKQLSKLLISTNYLSKMKNNELTLISSEPAGDEQ